MKLEHKAEIQMLKNRAQERSVKKKKNNRNTDENTKTREN